MAKGKFITLEGIDGAGKSTHLQWLVDFLGGRGITVVSTREPGGTPLGESLRALLLSETMHLETEALLMFAARRENLDKVIIPALTRGDWVVSDRFADASFAYQGGGRGLNWEKLRQLEDWVLAGSQPDLTLFFDLPTQIARSRLNASGGTPDRFEREQEDFFERVRIAYLRRITENALRIKRIDANKTVDAIRAELELTLTGFCDAAL